MTGIPGHGNVLRKAQLFSHLSKDQSEATVQLKNVLVPLGLRKFQSFTYIIHAKITKTMRIFLAVCKKHAEVAKDLLAEFRVVSHVD